MFPAELGNFYCKPMDTPQQVTNPVSPNPNVFENFRTAANTKHENENDGIKHIDLLQFIIVILCYYIMYMFFWQLCS